MILPPYEEQNWWQRAIADLLYTILAVIGIALIAIEGLVLLITLPWRKP